MTIADEFIRGITLLCATILVASRNIRAAEYNATDVIEAASLFEDYIKPIAPLKGK